jgi:hypothetical protein
VINLILIVMHQMLRVIPLQRKQLKHYQRDGVAHVYSSIKQTICASRYYSLELSTNGDKIVTDKQATVPGVGKVLFNPDAMINIFSCAEMDNMYQIMYDSDLEKSFVVHLPHKKVEFNWSSNGLYCHIPTYSTSHVKHTSLVSQSVDTVDENKLLFTDKQVQREKLAMQIYHEMGALLVNDFKAIIMSIWFAILTMLRSPKRYLDQMLFLLRIKQHDKHLYHLSQIISKSQMN